MAKRKRVFNSGPFDGHQKSVVPPLDAHDSTIIDTTINEESTITLFPYTEGVEVHQTLVSSDAKVGPSNTINSMQNVTINTDKREIRTVKSFVEELKETYQLTDLKNSVKRELRGKCKYVELSCKDLQSTIIKEKSHEEFESFLQETDPEKPHDSTKKVLLVMGDAGAGKSLTLKKWALERWKEYSTSDITQRIPLWINLSRCKEIYENIIGNYLQERFRYKFKTEELRRFKWCLFLDGYDEISEKKNIYNCNRFYEGWNIKIIIACRTQSIVGVRSDYEELFFPVDSGGKRRVQELQTLILQPFDEPRVEKFVKSRFADKKKASSILAKINDNSELKELINNPFLLEMMLTVVSKAEKVEGLAIFCIKTRYELLNACVGYQVKRDDDRLKNETQLNPTPYRSFTEGLEIFAQNLALSMFAQKEEYEQIREYHLQRPINELCYDSGDIHNPWRRFFADLNDGGGYQIWQHEIGVCLLEVKGNDNTKTYYGFKHKAILEYWAVRALISEYKSIYQYDETLKIGTWKGDKLYESGLNQRLLNDEPDFLDLLISQIDEADTDQDNHSTATIPPTSSSSSSFSSSSTTPTSIQKSNTKKILSIQALFDLILLSKHRNDITIAAANAATILNRMNFNFSGLELASIKIAGADLQQSLFYETDLREADLRWINFTDSILSGANLSESKMLGMDFGQLPLPWLEHDLKHYDAIVTCISYHPSGKYLASGDNSGIVNIWNVKDGTCSASLKTSVNVVRSVNFSPDGKYIVAKGRTCERGVTAPSRSSAIRHVYDILKYKSIYIWSIEENCEIQDHKLHISDWNSDCDNGVNFSPDSKHFAYINADSTICIWSVGKWEHSRSTVHVHSCCINFSQIGTNGRCKYLASGNKDNTVKIWNVENDDDECLVNLQEHGARVICVNFSPDGKYLASGSRDKTVKIWRMSGWECLATLADHLNEVQSINFSPIGANGKCEYLASGSMGGKVRIWSTGSWGCLKTLDMCSNSVESINFSPDEKYLVSGSWLSTIKIWNIENWKPLKTLDVHNGEVCSIDFSPNGEYMAWVGGKKKVEIRKVVGNMKNFERKEGHSDWVTSVSFSSDNRYLASGSYDKIVKIWSVENGKCLMTLQKHSSVVTCVNFSFDGKYLVSGSRDKTVNIWRTKGMVEQWEHLQTLAKHDGWVLGISFSKDNHLASVGDDNTVKIWKKKKAEEKWKYLQTLKHDGVNSVNFSLGSKYKCLASGGNETIKIWRWRKKVEIECLQTLDHGGVNSVNFGPDNKYLVSGGNETIKIWLWKKEVEEKLECLQTLKHGGVNSVNFGPGNKYLVSGGSDKTVKIWHLESGTCFQSTCIQTIKCHRDYVTDTNFSLNGNYLVSGSRDGSIKLWNIKEANNQLKCTLKWSTHYHFLTSEANLDGAIELSTPNAKLLKQNKATHVPSDTLPPEKYNFAKIQRQLRADCAGGKKQKNLNQTEPSSVVFSFTLSCKKWQLIEGRNSGNIVSHFLLEGINIDGYFIKYIYNFNGWEMVDLTVEQTKEFINRNEIRTGGEIRTCVISADDPLEIDEAGSFLLKVNKKTAKAVNLEFVYNEIFINPKKQISTRNQYPSYDQMMMEQATQASSSNSNQITYQTNSPSSSISTSNGNAIESTAASASATDLVAFSTNTTAASSNSEIQSTASAPPFQDQRIKALLQILNELLKNPETSKYELKETQSAECGVKNVLLNLRGCNQTEAQLKIYFKIEYFYDTQYLLLTDNYKSLPELVPSATIGNTNMATPSSSSSSSSFLSAPSSSGDTAGSTASSSSSYTQSQPKPTLSDNPNSFHASNSSKAIDKGKIKEEAKIIANNAIRTFIYDEKIADKVKQTAKKKIEKKISTILCKRAMQKSIELNILNLKEKISLVTYLNKQFKEDKINEELAKPEDNEPKVELSTVTNAFDGWLENRNTATLQFSFDGTPFEFLPNTTASSSSSSPASSLNQGEGNIDDGIEVCDNGGSSSSSSTNVKQVNNSH
jgi:WD40 repeat protein